MVQHIVLIAQESCLCQALNQIMISVPCGAGQPENAYMWAEFAPPLAGSCSAVRSVGGTNVLMDNYAGIAGGAVFATDMASFHMTCSDAVLLDDVAGCPSPAWRNNTVSGLPSVMGYVLIAAV